MFTNKIILTIITITAIIVIPIQFITTSILGLLVNLTFGLLLIPLSIVWVIIFYGPLLGLSYLYEKIFFLRPLIALIGIPLAVIADTYVALMPSMGEIESRCEKMIICQTFPYTWKYTQLKKDRINLAKNDVLNKIIKDIARAEPLHKHLDKLAIKIYSRESHLRGNVKIDW